MISSLRGKLITKGANRVVVECGGVGYGASMSLASLTRVGTVGDDVFVFIDTQLSQDALRLFGFADESERDVFRVLIGINGVGPKLALAILSVFSADELSTIVARQEKTQLVKIPGVGAKKAARLLLELKDKMPVVGITLDGPVGTVPAGSVRDDLHSAMLNLGYKEALVETVVSEVLDQHDAQADISTLVREALKLANPRI